ncbi:hypothetical protein GCM10010531_39120 [Blastococcus jejuensis]|uniref:Uncharacterized protein n=1 Tax=Blastococcus jejuensis TaxID=351224 RepID=A0ABP6PQM3_9ACTN
MKRTIGVIGALTLGLGLALAAPTAAGAAPSGTIYVPGDMDFSQTGATGHYEVQGSGLHIWTEGATSSDKVAGYVATSTPLAGIGEPSLDYAPTFGSVPPGYQLVVDFDGNGSIDGILVGEPEFYGNDWWLTNGSAQFVKDGAPSHTGGSGSANHGTLDQWRTAFPNAVVKAFGFSLGSGVYGDGVINSIEFDGTTYTFAEPVVLTSKDECKGGGWATSTHPVFKNQGECVSSFASKKKAASFSA